MDGVRDELERPPGQALSAGSRELRGGIQQQGAWRGGGRSSANVKAKMETLAS